MLEQKFIVLCGSFMQDTARQFSAKLVKYGGGYDGKKIRLFMPHRARSACNTLELLLTLGNFTLWLDLSQADVT